MTMLYIGVSADSVCFRRCTSHNCTKYLALARFRLLLITNIKPLRRRIQAESLLAQQKKRGFPGAKSQSAQHLWPFLVPRPSSAATPPLSGRTHATHPLRPGWLTPPVAVQPTPLSLDAVTFRQGRWKSKKRHRTARATALGAAGWGSGTTEPLRSPARARPDPDASQVRSTGVAAPVPSCPALAVLATSLRGPVPLSSYPHPLLSLRCAAAAAVPLPTEIP
ncbi:hypothetical protein N5P37_009699 [Trichoderma harzianum]|nr:hypothetical protein N5P37_009699 [Trichoderma harzianum]